MRPLPAREAVKVGDEYYIHPSALAQNIKKLRLKHGDSFLVCDCQGELPSYMPGELGFYHAGTRFLSMFETRIGGQPPLLLFSSVARDHSSIVVDFTNPPLEGDDGTSVPADSVYLRKELIVYQNKLIVSLRLANHYLERLVLPISLRFDSDFRDIFEVRGTKRKARGEMLEPECLEAAVRLRYRGLDGIARLTEISFAPRPASVSAREASYLLALEPRAEEEIEIVIGALCEPGPHRAGRLGLRQAAARLAREAEEWRAENTLFRSSNQAFNQMVQQAAADLRLLLTPTPDGPFPYAGLPWFAAPFGRDALITALQILPFNQSCARSVLLFLARYQGKRVDPFKDEQPGKIMHELRSGEMANLREIPFIPYYGTVDATPLFIMLAGEYFDWTGDEATLRRIWPNIEAALAWIENYGDMDGDGFVEYIRQSPKGLANQGWKDSGDSVSHADGRLAQPPIALCEVQGYCYAAWRAAARLAGFLEYHDIENTLIEKANELKRKFNRAFWIPELEFYAMALDRDKQPCRVISSNPGHCLWTEVADREKARAVASRMLSDELFCGWGIRTLGKREVRYNPMSYHNGSVWPFDTALAAAGFKRYGFAEEFNQLATALFEASLYLEGARLPELYCGFDRVPLHGPALYPVACTPQAWAAGAVFMLIGAMLGLEAQAWNRHLVFKNPLLPPWLEWLEVRNLRCGGNSVDLVVQRGKLGGSIEILSKSRDLDITVKR